jgi:NADPH:quinone reductase-like Zn-dependent oxidoreductase
MPRGFGFLGRLMLGLLKPRQPILGSELAGEVESVGKDVTQYRVGDAVFIFADVRMGCHVAYKCIAEDGAISLKPASLGYDEAAALSFGGTTALSFLRRAKLQHGEKVLVNGASGGVGTAAVQLAKHLGAHVTGVCGTANLALVRSLGVDKVIDYTTDDFTANGEVYDVIIDTVGTAPFSRSKRSLAANGRLLLVLGGLPDLLRAPWIALTSRTRIVAGPAAGRAEDLRLLGELAAAGKLRPVIDRRYRFEEIAEAHAYVDTGRKKGNVVVTLQEADWA